MENQVGYGLSADMFNTQRVNFHSFDGNKNGAPKEHRFRVLPAYAPGKLFLKVDLHWGYKKADGKQKALQCSKYDKGHCPICDRVDYLKGQLENIEASLATEFDQQSRAELESKKQEYTEYINQHRRKPMYLWNIITEEGEQKVLQLSWNGHDPLLEKIKFLYQNGGTDVTDLQKSQLMFCSRSGLMAKTRYQYELLSGFEKALTVTDLTKLDEVYEKRTVEFLKQVVDTNSIPNDQEDPNDRQFTTQQGTVAQTDQQHIVAPDTRQETVVQNTVAQQNVQPQNTVVQQNVQPQNTPDPSVGRVEKVVDQGVTLTQEQDQTVAEMMKALQG